MTVNSKPGVNEKVSSIQRGSTVSNGNRQSEANPFEEEEWDEYPNDDPLTDSGEPGVPVRALYDYEGAEYDELSFKKGTKTGSLYVLRRGQMLNPSLYLISLFFQVIRSKNWKTKMNKAGAKAEKMAALAYTQPTTLKLSTLRSESL